MAADLDFERTLHRNAARELAPAGSLFDDFANQVMRRVDEVLAGHKCPWPATPDHRRFLGQLRRHQGADRAVPLAALAERLSVTPRYIKSVVQDLRLHFGVQIGSARGEDNGYFLCASEAECIEATSAMYHQAITMLLVVGAMRGGAQTLEQLRTQIALDLGAGLEDR